MLSFITKSNIAQNAQNDVFCYTMTELRYEEYSTAAYKFHFIVYDY